MATVCLKEVSILPAVISSPEDIIPTAKQTLKHQIAFNEKAQFSQIDTTIPRFFREELIAPTSTVFDVDEKEIQSIWKHLDDYKEREKIWEVRIPPSPDIMMGVGVLQIMGKKIKAIRVKKAFLATDPFMHQSGRLRRSRTFWPKAALRPSSFPKWDRIPRLN